MFMWGSLGVLNHFNTAQASGYLFSQFVSIGCFFAHLALKMLSYGVVIFLQHSIHILLKAVDQATLDRTPLSVRSVIAQLTVAALIFGNTYLLLAHPRYVWELCWGFKSRVCFTPLAGLKTLLQGQRQGSVALALVNDDRSLQGCPKHTYPLILCGGGEVWVDEGGGGGVELYPHNGCGFGSNFRVLPWDACMQPCGWNGSCIPVGHGEVLLHSPSAIPELQGQPLYGEAVSIHRRVFAVWSM